MTSTRCFVGSVRDARRLPPWRLRHLHRADDAVVINTLADLLGELARSETEKLAKSDIKHPTLIGGMYEGLTRELLLHSIPDGLELHVVSGLVVDGRGGTSGQIDCMLVRGTGTPVPYSPGIYQWHVKDVIAVFEVKKNLFGGDLSDAYLHLRRVLATYSDWVQNAKGPATVTLWPTLRAYAQTMGEVAPPGDQWRNMPTDKHLILHTMMADQLAPLRIIFGYEGYSTERGLRTGFLTYLGENLNVHWFGPPSLPNLIVAKGASLVKLSGHPYHAQRKPDGSWPIMASSHLNPLLLVLELIWTRLSYEHAIAPLFGEDLDVEVLAPLLDAEPAQSAALPSGWGWRYESHDLSKKRLAGPNREPWSPIELDAIQFPIVNRLCRQDIDSDNPEFRSYLEGEGLDPDAFCDGLVATALVARNGRMLTLATEQCRCAVLPDGRRIAGEDNTVRLTRWAQRFMERHQSETEVRADVAGPLFHPNQAIVVAFEAGIIAWDEA